MAQDLFAMAINTGLLLLYTGVVGFSFLLAVNLPATVNGMFGNRLLSAFFSISLGLAALLFALFILSVTGFFSALAIILTAGVVLLLAIMILRRNIYKVKLSSLIESYDSFGLLVGIGFFVLVLVVTYHPPGLWDDTMYQLPLARHYLEHQSLMLHQYVRFGLFPQNINLLMALGLLLDGDLLAQAFVTVPLFVIALGLMGVSGKVCGHWFWGALTAGLLFVIQPVRYSLGYAYIDNAVALFCFSATLAVVFWFEKPRYDKTVGWVLVAAVLAGTASGSKIFGAVLAVILGVYILLMGRSVRGTVIFGVITLIFGAGWYLRSYLISGDPIHPFGGSYFGYFLWNADDLASQYQEQETFGVVRNLLYLPQSLWSAGVIFWLLAFAGFFLVKVPRYIRTLQVVFLLYFCFWFFVSQVDRYLSPIYGAGMALSSYTLYRSYAYLEFRLPVLCKLKRPAVILTSGVLVMMLVAGGIYRYEKRDLVAVIEKRLVYFIHGHDGYQSIQRPGVQLFIEADKYIDQYGARLMQLGFENAVYFFSGETIGDWFGLGRYSDRVTCTSSGCLPLPEEKMRRQMEYFGAYLLVISLERYPGFDVNSYLNEFTIISQDEHGVLFALKGG